jgi:hypothetical protein
MGLQLVLCLKGHVALGLAGLIGTNHVGLGEMDLQIVVFFVIYVLVMIAAQVAHEMVARQMVEEHQVIEEKLFAKVAVRMRQDLSVAIIANISELNMFS